MAGAVLNAIIDLCAMATKLIKLRLMINNDLTTGQYSSSSGVLLLDCSMSVQCLWSDVFRSAIGLNNHQCTHLFIIIIIIFGYSYHLCINFYFVFIYFYFLLIYFYSFFFIIIYTYLYLWHEAPSFISNMRYIFQGWTFCWTRSPVLMPRRDTVF